MERIEGRTINPWISIWTRPRATIELVAASRNEGIVWVLAALAGFSQSLDRASMRSLGDHMEWPMILLIAAIAGSLGGLVMLQIGSIIFRWTGRYFHAQAPIDHIRAAMAWSQIPGLLAMLLWIPEIAIFGQELFTTETPVIDSSSTLKAAIIGFAVVEIGLSIWSLILFFICMSQVQRYSVRMAILHSIIILLAIILPIVLLFSIF